MQNEDQKLVAKLYETDEGSFNELVKKYENKLINGSYKITCNREVSEEIVQETFLTFYLKIEKFKEESGVFTYLYRMMLNKSIDYLRRKKNYEKIANTLDTGIKKWDEETDIKIVVDEALGKLSLKLKIPLLLAEYEKLKYDQISEILKIPVNTVRSRIFKAREKLLEIFESMGVEL
jgi:RNA polymerase sigma-70 factor, ECF subfamily